MVNWIGDAMVQEVVAGLDEPTCANQITVGGEVAVFERVRNLRFINRFGEEVVRPRRCYRYRNRAGGVAPLDVKRDRWVLWILAADDVPDLHAGRRRVVCAGGAETGGRARVTRRGGVLAVQPTRTGSRPANS